MNKKIFLIVGGVAIGAIAALGYEIYKSVRSLKEDENFINDYPDEIDFCTLSDDLE